MRTAMPMDNTRARELLGAGDLRPLFIEALGWDRHAAMLQVTVGGMTHALHAIAQKRGMIAWQCPTPAGVGSSGPTVDGVNTKKNCTVSPTRIAHVSGG